MFVGYSTSHAGNVLEKEAEKAGFDITFEYNAPGTPQQNGRMAMPNGIDFLEQSNCSHLLLLVKTVCGIELC